MLETYISFYLRSNKIHIFVEALRALGKPSRICFMIEENGATLLVTPYGKRDFVSHAVPQDVYSGTAAMEVSSYKLCRIIASLYDWDLSRSYRVPGMVFPEKKIAIFDLKKAEIIDRFEIE